MIDATRRLAVVLPEREPLLWLGAYALLAHAGPDGDVSLLRAAAEFREAVLARERQAAETIGRTRAAQSMETAAVLSYLTENVVGRLAERGLARLDRREGAPADRVALVGEEWRVTGEERATLLRELGRRGGLPVEGPTSAAPRAVVGRAHVDGPLTPSVLRAEGLAKSFARRRVVDDVSLEVRQGEIVGLLGPNGAGKTTTFYMIVGLIAADEGRVFLDERELTRVPMYKRARAGIGYLSQEPSVFRRLTVEENVMAILETLPLSRETRHARLESLLDELGLKPLRRSKAYSLSGGERRRLEITRALVTRPKFMLLDEPFAGVDPIAVDDIQRIVAELRERGLGVLITDHNVRETLSITDRAYLMFNGRIHIEGPAEALVADPEARKMYLGLDFRL